MDEQTTGPAGPEDVIIAVADPDLAQEAMTVVAATGRRSVPVTSPQPNGAAWRRCAAILADTATIRYLVDVGAVPLRSGVTHVHADDGDPATDLVRLAGCDDSLPLPACGADLVAALGRPGGSGRPAGWGGVDVGEPGQGRGGEPGARPRGGRDDGRDLAGDSGDPGNSGAGAIIAVQGATGGAGASVCAAAIAVACARRADTILVDADPFSGGADLLLGLEAEPGVRWTDVRADTGSIDGAALLGAVPSRPGGPGVLAGPRSRADTGWEVTAGAVGAVADAMVAAGGIGVIDLPAWGPAPEAVSARADVLVLVVPAAVRGIASATRLAAMHRRAGGDPVAVLRLPAPGGATAADVEFATGMDVVAEVPRLKSLDREIEAEGIGRSARRLIDALSPVLELLPEPWR